MKLLSLLLMVFAVNVCSAQKPVAQADKIAIKKTVTQFLKWYKKFEADTSNKSYQITKGGYPDTTTQVRIDAKGLEQYLNEYTKTGLVSDIFINSIRDYFQEIDKTLAHLPPSKELTKIPGLDIDPILQTYEPEMILDHISQSKINEMHIIYRKALVSVHFSAHTDLLFVLTRQQKYWVIDFLGADATDKNSLFRQ